MNFIIYFFIVIIGYLSLAKTSYVGDYAVSKLDDIETISDLTIHPPATLLLTSIKSRGHFIKSHYLKLKLVSAFHDAQDIQIRIPANLVKKLSSSIGLSIYNISTDSQTNVVIKSSIPGMHFVGNPQLGRWIKIDGEEHWSFYKAYQHLPQDLGWENFLPTITDWSLYQNAKQGAIINNYPQYFGTGGNLTKKMLLQTRNEKKSNHKSEGINLLRSYFKL